MTAPRKATRATAVVPAAEFDEGTEPLPEYPVGSVENTNNVVAQLQQMMADQQAQIDKLLAEKGLPKDPVAAQIQALQDHLHAQANANPNHGATYAPALSYVDGLTSDALTTNKAAKALRLVGKLRGQVPSHELAYAHELADGLHEMTLPDEDE